MKNAKNTISIRDFKRAVRILRKNENKPKFEIYFDREFPFIHWGYFYTVYKYKKNS